MLFGQSKRKYKMPVRPTKKQLALAEKHYQCFYQNKYNAQQRRSIFPFNTAVEIQIISFKPSYPMNNDIKEVDGKLIEIDRSDPDTVPVFTTISKDRYLINYRKVINKKTLSAAGVDSLTDILYNYTYTPITDKDFIEVGNPGCSCYEPTKAILFIDRDHHVTQYMRTCFKCERHFWSSSKVNEIEYCTGKYQMLEKFFFKQGVIRDPEIFGEE
jgi:hypothetical protein